MSQITDRFLIILFLDNVSWIKIISGSLILLCCNQCFQDVGRCLRADISKFHYLILQIWLNVGLDKFYVLLLFRHFFFLSLFGIYDELLERVEHGHFLLMDLVFDDIFKYY